MSHKLLSGLAAAVLFATAGSASAADLHKPFATHVPSVQVSNGVQNLTGISTAVTTKGPANAFSANTSSLGSDNVLVGPFGKKTPSGQVFNGTINQASTSTGGFGGGPSAAVTANVGTIVGVNTSIGKNGVLQLSTGVVTHVGGAVAASADGPASAVSVNQGSATLGSAQQ